MTEMSWRDEQHARAGYDMIVYVEGNLTVVEDKFGQKRRISTANEDDSTLIQYAIDQTPDGGSVGIFGSFIIKEDIIVRFRNYLTIEGTGTLKRVDHISVNDPTTSTHWADIMRLEGCEYCTIKDLTFDGNYTNQDYCNDGSHPETLPWGGKYGESNYVNLYLRSCNYCLVDNVTSFDSGTNNIRAGGSTADTIIQTPSNYNTFSNNKTWGGRNGILLFSDGDVGLGNTIAGEGNNIIGNYSEKGHGYAGVYVYAYDTDIVGNVNVGYLGNPEGTSNSDGIRVVSGGIYNIIGNVCFDNAESGIHTMTGITGINITGNYCYNNSYDGIENGAGIGVIGDNVIMNNKSTGIASTGNNIQIENNTVYYNNSTGIAANGNNTIIKGNEVSYNGNTGIQYTNAENCTIEGNMVFDNGRLATWRRGIYVYETSSQTTKNIHIKNNMVFDDGAGTQEYALKFYEADAGYLGDIYIEGNQFFGNTVGVIDGTTAGIQHYYRNIGYTTENDGVSTQSGDGTTTTFTIPHGLVAAPSKYEVTPLSSDARDKFDVSVDDTNITITYATAPASGTDNLKWYWKAEV